MNPELLSNPQRVSTLSKVLEKRHDDITIVLENVHDPHNVAAVLRSCDATGLLNVHWIYYGKQKIPDLGKKTSGSAKKWIDISIFKSVEESFAELRAQGRTIITTHLDSTAVSVYDVDFTKPCAIVFGNEHEGVSATARELADYNMIIPQFGFVQSLNISVACAVTLFEAMRQRMKAGLYDTPRLSEEARIHKLEDWLKR